MSRSAALGHWSTAAATSIFKCSGTSASATCTTSDFPITKMSGANDSQNPLASHNVSSTITRIAYSLFSQPFGPGSDHPGRCQTGEFLVGEPTHVPQYLTVVLTERGRRAHQPRALSIKRGERRPRVAPRTGARMLECLQEPAVVELTVLGDQRRRHHRCDGNARSGEVIHRTTQILAAEPVLQPTVDLVGMGLSTRDSAEPVVVGPGRAAHHVGQRLPLVVGANGDGDPVVVARAAVEVLDGTAVSAVAPPAQRDAEH